MKKTLPTKERQNDAQLDSQRRALRWRLNQMLKELDGAPVSWRTYQHFPYGLIEKSIEITLRSLEIRVRGFVLGSEKRLPKKEKR